MLRIGCFSRYILGQDPQKRRRRRVFKYGAVQTILARYLITNDSRRNGLPVESFRRRSQVASHQKRARRLVNIIKSSVSKLFEYCTIRHIAMSVEMTYVHTDIVRKRPPQLTF